MRACVRACVRACNGVESSGAARPPFRQLFFLLNSMTLNTGGRDLLEEAVGGVCCGQVGSALPNGDS